MRSYLDLDRRFGLLANYSPEELFAVQRPDKGLGWDDVLQGRFSVIVGPANFGKTMELRAKCADLLAQGKFALYIALHKLRDDDLDGALDAECLQALTDWRTSRTEIVVFADSLDEASLGTDDGGQRALRRLINALGRNADVRWVLSTRPAMLTLDLLTQLQAEFGTKLYVADGREQNVEVGRETIDDEDDLTQLAPQLIAPAASAKTRKKRNPPDPLKIYRLSPLDRAAAAVYLRDHCQVADPDKTLTAAWQYGLGGLVVSPGGLDILASINIIERPIQSLTQAFDRLVTAVQQQQRADPREGRLGSPPPASLGEAMQRLASASVICQLPNIEMAADALRHRDGVLSARPIVASVLTEHALTYLLGSCLFIDTGKHEVKLYPDELTPFLAAKHLAALVRSPEHARRLMSNFTWHASTGECGVRRTLLPLAGWLAVFNSHCRQELLSVEPQAVAFFGDLRSPLISLTEASLALERAIERIALQGDTIGRTHYVLTAENYWQAAKPGIEPTVHSLFEKYGTDDHARDALLGIAKHARLETLRNAVLAAHAGDYAKLIHDRAALSYLVALECDDDLQALGAVLRADHGMPEPGVARLLEKLAWKVLDARSIAAIVAREFEASRDGFWLAWTLTRDLAEAASDAELYQLVRSLLLRLKSSKQLGRRRGGERFIEIILSLVAVGIDRRSSRMARLVNAALIVQRHLSENSFFGVDTTKLQLAFQANKAARLSFMRGLIARTDKTSAGIRQAYYPPMCPVFDDDKLDLDEPGFSEFVEGTKPRSAPPVREPARRRDREKTIDAQSKNTLLGMLDEIENGSAESALSWVSKWVVQATHNSRYGEWNPADLEHAAGEDLARAVQIGLRKLWRIKEPVWNELEPHSTYNITVAGLQGLHLDLGDGATASAVSDADVGRAIRYAQFELNGYPKWFWPLVNRHSSVAELELQSILANAHNGPVSKGKAEKLLRHLGEASEPIKQRLGYEVWQFIRAHPELPEHTTEAALEAIAHATSTVSQQDFEVEAWRMVSEFKHRSVPLEVQNEDGSGVEAINFEHQGRARAVMWGSLWLRKYPVGFCKQWERWRAADSGAAEGFMFKLAVHLGEDSSKTLNELVDRERGLDVLKRLYEWLHDIVREEDDIEHEEGRGFTPGDQDHASRVRSSLIPAIAHAKNEHAYQILEQIRQHAPASRAKYLRYTQFMMREAQFATNALQQEQYQEFERTLSPAVSDYKSFAMAVETDLLTVKNEIECGDFSLRRFFSSISFTRIKTDNEGLALEEDFQALLGSELNHLAQHRYAVSLEPILPESTRRDVLCQAGSLRATVELKMSARWSFPDYVEALVQQLQGQYMKAINSKIGFFVIVLQQRRTWKNPDGKSIDFEGLLEALRRLARQKEEEDSNVILRVIGIDATPRADFRATRRNVVQAADSDRPETNKRKKSPVKRQANKKVAKKNKPAPTSKSPPRKPSRKTIASSTKKSGKPSKETVKKVAKKRGSASRE